MDAQAGLGLYCYKSPDWFSQSRSNCYMCNFTMAHIRKQDAKFDYRAKIYDNSDRIVTCAVSSKHFQ